MSAQKTPIAADREVPTIEGLLLHNRYHALKQDGAMWHPAIRAFGTNFVSI
jgi:hypothetical protein